MRAQMAETLFPEVCRSDGVNRARASLGFFITAVKDSAPGGNTYKYNLTMGGKTIALQRYNESVGRLARACKRAELDFNTVLLENNITLI